MSQDTYLKNRWARLTKAELIDAVIDAEKVTVEIRKLRQVESDERLRTIANLQARCLTMRHQQLRRQQTVVALEQQIAGLKMVEISLHQSRNFDIRNPNVVDRISKLFDSGVGVPSALRHRIPLVPIHVCPRCGKITQVESGRSGERMCEKCLQEADWPWEGEVVWHVNEGGKMEGRVRGKHDHPDGSTMAVQGYQQAK